MEEEVSSGTVESALLKLLNVLLKSESLDMNEGHGTLVSLSLPPSIYYYNHTMLPTSLYYDGGVLHKSRVLHVSISYTYTLSRQHIYSIQSVRNTCVWSRARTCEMVT